MPDYHVRSPSRDRRDPQTRSLRSRSSSRDMGWRKPVPKFIPSPPISPNQSQSLQYTGSPTSTTFEYALGRTNPFSMSMASLKGDLPPLPTDWKENIDRVIRNESSTNLRSLKTPPISPVATSPTHGFARGCHQNSAVTQIPEMDRDRYAFQEVDLGERKSRSHRHCADKENIPPPVANYGLRRMAMSPGANESTASLSRTPKTYRPPTPPIPSRKRSSAPPTPVTATMNKPMHMIYPDLAGIGAEAHSERTKSPESDDTVDTHTLHTARSSLTTGPIPAPLRTHRRWRTMTTGRCPCLVLSENPLSCQRRGSWLSHITQSQGYGSHSGSGSIHSRVHSNLVYRASENVLCTYPMFFVLALRMLFYVFFFCFLFFKSLRGVWIPYFLVVAQM